VDLQTFAKIPRPTVALVDEDGPLVAPAPELGEWARSTLLSLVSDLYNEDHAHLEDATIGFLWALVPFKDKGRHVLGTAQLGPPSGKAWQVAKATQQLNEWYGEVPDFLITVDGRWAFEHASDLELCAVVDHELYHCHMVLDENGEPRVNPVTGRPQWYVRGHDVEEFVGVVRRYGAWNSGLRQMKRALEQEPMFGEVDIAGACGLCLK
jgi:hypothetical protein